ncbi:mucin-12 [Pieris rapae]|uniref:mucin-12 n=1 Tax=Pieris rapae TaxID=64459 RepID=UPI001E27FBD7|nr:mucin-12 [Pieris rapae]
MDQRRAAAALFALAACFACATAAPTASNQTALDIFEAPVEGCYYNFQHYGEGDRIMTNEPCLNCTCHNRMLMCYLRVCPFTKPIGQDCTVEKRADQCCPIVTCPDVPVDLLTSTSTSSPAEYGATGLGKMDKYGCSINGKYFPEGSKVPPTPNKPCEHCYCIHNMTTCVMQECTLHVDGCTPIYHKDVCCPIRYSCDHAEDEIPLLDDMTTTVRPTPGFLLTTTTMMPVTQASQDCVHDDKIFSDGALIKTEKACEHCYCMKGDIVCVVQECGTPMENEGKNCTSLPPKQGQCCPDTYICEGDELSTAQFNDETTTLTPPRRFGVEGSGYRNEPDESYTETSSIGDTEIEGSGEDFLTTIPGLHSDTPPVTSHNVYPYSTEINAVSSEVTTQSDIVDENKVLPTESSDFITSTNTNDSKGDKDDEKDLNVMTTVAPSDQPMYTTSVEDNLKQKQDTTSNDISTTKTLDQYTTLEPNVTPKLNEVLTEITTKQSLLDDVDNMTPIDEEFIIATKLPEKTDNIENSFEETLTTFKPMHSEESITEQGSSETTPKEMTFTEQPTYSSVTTSSQETTTINVQENEILEETLPARIPGEGDCLLGGVTFKNNTSVPSTNKCHISCKCVSSIIKCDPIICTPPLEYMENMNDCQPIYDSPDSCCPTYVCNTKETIAPESHSQMSGTESPKPTECVGDVCQNTEPSVLPQNDINNCRNGNCDSKKEQIPVSETQQCDETTGCQVPVIKPCEGENCITNPVVPTDTQDNLETNNKPCNNENECQVPVITPCMGDDCITGSKLPNNKETDVLDKETKDEEIICKDENCRRKEYDETKANVPCSGTDCKQQDTVSPSVVNDVSSSEPGPPISTSKPNQAKQPEDFTLSEPQSTLEPFVETTVPSITTSSEIKQTVETIREESTTQNYLVDDSLISHQPDSHSEAVKPSTEPSVSDIDRLTPSIFDLSTVKEHLVIATEQATTEYSSKTSDETIIQYTTLGASLDDKNTESTTGMPDKTEIGTETVSKENTKDTYNMLTDYPKVESTTADTRVSSEIDKESNQNEFIHVTGRPIIDEKTTYDEILEENIATSVPRLPSSVAYDESSSDTTESEISFTKEIPDKDLSVQPISDVTGTPDFISGHLTTEQRENYPSTLTPETEEHDSVSSDVPTVTEAEVIEEATEIFYSEGTTFQPESHKQSETELTSPSAIEENQTQKAIDKDIPELFTEVSFATTTEFNQNDSQKDQSEIEQDLTSIDKQEAQTIIPEIKYTEVIQDFTTKLPQNPTEDKISDIRKDIEQNTETLTTIAPLIINEETTTNTETNESPSEKPVVDKEITTLRINEPSDYTTSKQIENAYTNEFEKTTEYLVNLSGDKINTTPIYNDISEETTIISLPNISESVSEFVTDIATENYHIKDTHTVTEPSNELDKTGNEQVTESSNALDKTIPEQSTGLPDELQKTVTEKSTGLPNESDNTSTEPSKELDKTGSEQSTASPNESDKTVTEQSTGSPNELDKTGSEQSTASPNDSDKTVTEQSTGLPNESDKKLNEQSTEPTNESDKTVTEQATGSPIESDETIPEQSTGLPTESDEAILEQSTVLPNESDKTDEEQSTESNKTGTIQSSEPSNESQKTVAEQSTGSPNESDETVTEQSAALPNGSDTIDEEQSTELDKHVTEPSTGPSNESDKTGSELATGSPNEPDKTDKEQSTESDKTGAEQSTESSNESDQTVTEQSTGSPNDSEESVTEQSSGSPNESEKTDKEQTTDSGKTVTEQSTGPSNESDKTGYEKSTESPNESDKTGTEQSTGSPNESDKIYKEQSTESDKTAIEQSTASSNEADKTGSEQSTGSPNESDKIYKEQSTESDKTATEQSTASSNESDKTGSEQSTGSSNESDHTGSEPATESSHEFDKASNEQSTESPNIFDKTVTEQSTKSSNELVNNEIVQPTESPNESKPEIFITDKIEKDEMTISNTDKPNTTLLDEPVDTMTPDQSTESSVNDDLGQSHVLEIEKLAVTTQTNIIPEVPEKETTLNPESELSSTTSPIAIELEQETKASTDRSESQENQTLSPMSLITEKPHTVTVTENIQTIAVTTKESEPTTGVEFTTVGKDLLTTKQNADTVTPSIESTSRIKDSDVTTESPKEEPTSKASQSLDESVLGSITEQPGTEIEMTSTPITQNENESKQELPGIEDESSLISTTLSDILMEKEHQGDVSTKPSVLSETHDATDYPIFIEEKTKQPELFTTDLITESTKKSDQITEEPLSISPDPQEITMSSVDEHTVSNSQDGISTTVIVENEFEKFTKAPELPITPSDADTVQQEIDSTKHREPEGSTETSYETHTKTTTVKEEIFIPTQHDILSQDKTDKTISTQSLQTVTPEQFATNSPIDNTKLDSISSTLTDTTGISTERTLADKIDVQEATTESKYEYSETTPYFVELEEHTHQIMQETSIMPMDETSTEKASSIESTERGDQSLFDNLGNGLTEKSTDVTKTPHGYSQETTLSSNDIYTTTASEVSSSSETQKDTELREQDKLEPTDEGIETTLSPTQTPSLIQNEEKVTSIPLVTKKPTIPDLEIISTTEKSHTVMNEEAQKPDVLLETKIPDEYTKTTTPHYVHEEITSVKTTLFDDKLIETSSTTSKPITTKPTDDQATDEIPSPEFPPSGDSGYGQEPDYGEEEQAVIPGICRYGGKVYGSTQQIPRDDPCDFCFCFRSDIICLQQSCPPPIHGCREEPIQGFCCPRYECPVSMATTLNVTTTTTTTTTTLPPHFLPHAYKGAAQRRGCHIKGHSYKVGEVVRASSGPCLHCTCGGDGQMKCDPKACTPEPMLRQMIAAAVSARRR